MQPNEQTPQSSGENQTNSNPQPQPVSTPQVPPATPVSQPQTAPAPSQQPASATPQNNASLPALPARTGKPSQLKTMTAIIGVVLIIAAVGAFLGYLHNGSNDPRSVFQAALKNGMSTSQIREISTAKSNGKPIATDNIELDLSNVKDPRAYGTSKNTALLFGMKNKLYSSFNNEYVSIEHGVPGTPKSVQNKWIMLKKNGAYLKSSNAFGSASSWNTDITQFLYGPWPFGNFSSDDQAELTGFISSNNIYNYNAKSVKKTTFNGHKVYRYSITMDAHKLSSLAEKEAELMGLSPRKAKKVGQNLAAGTSSTSPAIFYVDISSKQLVGVSENDKAQHIEATVNFSDYDSLKLPAEPTPQITIDQYDSAVGPPTIY